MKFQKRGFASLLLALSFLVATVSGVVLYLAPRGRTANWTDWSMLMLGKHEWSAIHVNSCLLLLIAAALHVQLNWAVLCSYGRKMFSGGVQLKQEALLAVLFTVLVTVGTYLNVPPFSFVTDFQYQIKAYWDRQASGQEENASMNDDEDWQRPSISMQRSTRG